MLAPATTLLDLMEGQRRADRGMALAGSGNDDAREKFRAEASAAIVTLARTQEFVFVDDLVGMLSVNPPDPNCWGGVWLRAIKDRLIEKTEKRRRTAQPGKHAHEYPIYRSRLFTAR